MLSFVIGSVQFTQTHLGRARSKSVDKRMARKRRAESVVSKERSRSSSKAPKPRDKSGVRDDVVSCPVLICYVLTTDFVLNFQHYSSGKLFNAVALEGMRRNFFVGTASVFKMMVIFSRSSFIKPLSNHFRRRA